jgi:predicted phage gp36 major capsid-like protein
MNAYVYTSKLVLVSNQLLQDTAFNLDAWLSGKLGTRIARATNTHFTTGDGREPARRRRDRRDARLYGRQLDHLGRDDRDHL